MIQEIFSSEEDKDGTGETAKKGGDRLEEDISIVECDGQEECNDAVREEEEDVGCYLPPQVNHIRTQTRATTGNYEERHIRNASCPIVLFIENDSDCEGISDGPVPLLRD